VVRHLGESEGDKRGECDHEPKHQSEHAQLPSDQQAPADQDDVGHRHPETHRYPPEVERLRVLRAESDEGEDKGDIGRVEDVPSLPADQVLGGHPERHHADKDLDPMRAPPLAVEGAWDAKDESRAVACQQAARRPDDRVVLEKHHQELDERAGGEADQDLGDREPEP